MAVPLAIRSSVLDRRSTTAVDWRRHVSDGSQEQSGRTGTGSRPPERRATGLRVTLRPPTPSDAADFLGGVRASRSLHRPWIRAPGTLEDYERYLLRCAEEAFQGFLICRAEDGAIVGVANLSQIHAGNFRNAYLDFYAFTPYASQGYITEGVGLVLRQAFTALSLHRIEANVQPGNARPRALVQRLGFRLEGFSPRYLKIGGRWRDHERWALLAEEWRAGIQGAAPTRLVSEA